MAKIMNKYPKRKTTRLKHYNYSQPGYYYVTICADNRQGLFGNIKQEQMILNKCGEIIKICIQDISNKYPNAKLDTYVIMPNHVHIIIQIVGAGFSRPDNMINNKNYDNVNNNIINGRENLAPTLGQIIAYFKYNSTKQINALKNNGINKIWQRNFYDHIILNDKSLHKIREYIINNPANWDNDKHNPNKKMI